MNTPSDRIPSIYRQGFNVRLIDTEPGVRNYNSGLLVHEGRQFIATRRFDHRYHLCDIDINEVMNDGNDVKRIATLDLPRAHGREHFEDGRLFRHRGKVYIAYTEGRYWQVPYVSVQMLAEIEPKTWSVTRTFAIGYGNNTLTSEKNWQFFSRHGVLHFVYSISPHVVVRLDDNFRAVSEHVTEPPLYWPYGTMSGGTPPVKVGQEYYSFFHSYTPHPTNSRRYSFSAYTFQANPPFAITRISRPIMVASGQDRILDNPAYPYWKPLVIFPCGAAHASGKWVITAGVNDSFDVMIHLDHEDVVNRLLPIRTFSVKEAATRYFKTRNPTRPIRYKDEYVSWDITKGNPLLATTAGFKRVGYEQQGIAHYLSEMQGVTEITQEEYANATDLATA